MGVTVEVDRCNKMVFVSIRGLSVVVTYTNATGIKQDQNIDDRWIVLENGVQIGTIWNADYVKETW